MKTITLRPDDLAALRLFVTTVPGKPPIFAPRVDLEECAWLPEGYGISGYAKPILGLSPCAFPPVDMPIRVFKTRPLIRAVAIDALYRMVSPALRPSRLKGYLVI